MSPLQLFIGLLLAALFITALIALDRFGKEEK